MKRILNKIIIITIFLSIWMTGTVNAAGYQANKNTKSKVSTTANDFFEGIRNMEAAGGTLGTEAVIDINGGQYTDSSENGIDCHMALNTEWGTVAMLAASAYGVAPNGKSDDSTTGNASGVYQMADGTSEFVAGIFKTGNSNISKIFNADAIYRNLYKEKVSKSGDATLETQKWKGASYANFLEDDVNPVFLRDNGGLFGFSATFGGTHVMIGSRAVVVCGSGL